MDVDKSPPTIWASQKSASSFNVIGIGVSVVVLYGGVVYQIQLLIGLL